MSNSFYFVHANPEAWNKIGEFLAARGEIVKSETIALLVAQTEYPCWQIRGEDVKFIREYARDNSDIATNVRLFVRYEGQGKNAHDVSFMLRKTTRIRNEVLTSVVTRGIRGASGSRNQLLRRAK